MNIVCPKCHRKFKGANALFMDRKRGYSAYYCGRCLDPQKGSKAPRECIGLLLFMLFFALILANYGNLAYQDSRLRQEWQGLETTPISQLKQGETARIEGTINANESKLVLGGEEAQKGRYTIYWAWDGTVFSVTDGNDSLLVSTRNYYEIEYGTNEAPNQDELDARVYYGGDPVVIIGKLEKKGGYDEFQVLWMGPDEEGMEAENNGGLWSFTAAGIVVLFFSLPLLLRGYDNTRLVQGEEVTDPWESVNQETPDILWKDDTNHNHYYLAALGFVLLLALFSSWLTFSEKSMDIQEERELQPINALCWIFSPLLLFSMIILTLKYQDLAERPGKIGVSSLGFHLYSPHPDFPGPDFVAWEDIATVEKDELQTIERKEHICSIVSRDGTRICLDQLKPESQSFLFSEFRKRRPVSEELVKKAEQGGEES